MGLLDLSKVSKASLAQTYGNNFNPGDGSGDTGLNYAQAFGPGLTAAVKYGDGFRLYKGLGEDRMRANATADGSVGAWRADPTTSDAQMALQAAALGAAAYGGLSAGGFLSGGGVGSGAGFVGEGVSSGVPAWDGAMGGSMLEAGSAGGGLLNDIGGKALDFATKNPRMVAGLLGGLSGGVGGESGGYTGPMPTISQGNWSPSVQAQTMPVTDVSALTKMPKKGMAGSGLFRFMG